MKIKGHRPDLVILDDPQTDDSAGSLAQNRARLRVVAKAVLGLAGPKKQIAALMPCTVIFPADMADQILDAKKHPRWNGERFKMVYAFPVNTERFWLTAEVMNVHRVPYSGAFTPYTAGLDGWVPMLQAVIAF